MVQEFKAFLKESDLSKNTVESYVWTVNSFISKYGVFSKEKLLAYKGFMTEHFNPQTINLRLQAINKYLEFIHRSDLKLKFVKVQQKNFLENVISDADYRFLKRKLKSDGLAEWYFVVWFMGATGARISELLKIKAEHVEVGYLDLYSKGGKTRRLCRGARPPQLVRKRAHRFARVDARVPERRFPYARLYTAGEGGHRRGDR